MKHLFLFSSILLSALTAVSCGINEQEHNRVLAQVDSLKQVVAELTQKNVLLRDSVKILSFPADQRYNLIVNLVNEGNFEAARQSIADLTAVFPNSKEAALAKEQITIIEKKEAEIKAEEERLKALGYKVFKDRSSVTIDDRTCSFSSFSFGRTYTFDSVGDVGEYHYDTADKGNTFILASMSMTTKKDYASTPTFAVYKIVDGNLQQIRSFREEYAYWSTYGAFIGNYSEDSHDFSKVNTVRYKIAAEISIEDSKLPLVILCNKTGEYPKQSYTLEETNEACQVIKIINRNKI